MTSTQVQEFMNAGYSFIPCGTNKVPWVQEWGQYQYRRPEPDEIGSMQFLDAPCVGLIAGQVSGGIECVDVDIKNDPKGTIWEEIKALVKEKNLIPLLKRTTIQKTMSGGYHIIYKCDVQGRNEQLAYPKNSKEPIIETRANGGYFLVFPSTGYTLIQGSITDIKRITPEERESLMEVFRKLNRKVVAKQIPITTTTSRKKDLTATVLKVIAQLEQAQVDITAGYSDWIKIGHGFAHHFSEDGREYFHRVSSLHPEYIFDECNKKYDSFLASKNKRREATIRSFLALARDYGVDIRDPEDPDIYNQFVRAQALRWNKVTNKLEDRYGEPWNDFKYNQLWIQCRADTSTKITTGLFQAYLYNMENIEAYNPLTEYFDSLAIREYEGDPLSDFLDHLRLKDDGWRPFIKKWLLSVVASAYGYPSELILVLIGPQHNGKSEFFLRLFPTDLKDYLAVDKLDQGKDSDILMTQKLIILDDEFSGKSKKDARHLKELASKKVFSLRLPYGRTPVDLRRLAVLCGASNTDDVINDNTGNRRIIPVELISRDYKAADKVNRTDMWAQLVQEYFAMENNEGWYLTSDEVRYVKEQSEGHQSVNVEQELVLKHFAPDETRLNFMTATDVVDCLTKAHPGIKLWPQKVGQELTQLGFEKTQKKICGMPRKGYYVMILGEDGQKVDKTPF